MHRFNLDLSKAGRAQLNHLIYTDSPSSEESDEADDNYVGVGGKWQFVGEPIKKNARRKFYDVSGIYAPAVHQTVMIFGFLQALKVFSGDTVHVGDDVLLSASDNMPP